MIASQRFELIFVFNEYFLEILGIDTSADYVGIRFLKLDDVVATLNG